MKNSLKSRSAGPLVSILIPAFNSAKYLGLALDSVLAQTYNNIEIIVHDDASTDATPSILKKYSDPRLHIIRTVDNHGMIGGWNYIVAKAKGEYIKFLASDDLLAPTAVAELVRAALAHLEAAIITSQRQFIDEQGRVIKKMGFSTKHSVVDGKTHAHWILTTLRENKIGEPTAVLYPRALVKEAGEYDPRFSQFADFEYWIRLLQFGDLVYVDKPLCSFRLHASSNTAAAIRDGRFITETFQVIKKYHYLLTPAERSSVTRMKILDTLKNIKDLMFTGKITQALRYTGRLVSSVVSA